MPMVVTVGGMVTLVIAAHRENASVPMLLRPG